jgi:hypothetical protein
MAGPWSCLPPVVRSMDVRMYFHAKLSACCVPLPMHSPMHMQCQLTMGMCAGSLCWPFGFGIALLAAPRNRHVHHFPSPTVAYLNEPFVTWRVMAAWVGFGAGAHPSAERTCDHRHLDPMFNGILVVRAQPTVHAVLRLYYIS